MYTDLSVQGISHDPKCKLLLVAEMEECGSLSWGGGGFHRDERGLATLFQVLVELKHFPLVSIRERPTYADLHCEIGGGRGGLGADEFSD